MNQLLQLKGSFEGSIRQGTAGPRNLPKNAIVATAKLDELIAELEVVEQYWSREQLLSGALVNVVYIQTLAKSNRLSTLFTGGGKTANEAVVGAKFSDDLDKKHIITYYITKDVLRGSIQKLRDCRSILVKEFGGSISNIDLNAVNSGKMSYKNVLLKRSPFASIVVESHYVEHFFVQKDAEEIEDAAIVNLYKTDDNLMDRLLSFNIDLRGNQNLDSTTFLLYPSQLSTLKAVAPYLIAMATKDISEYSRMDFEPAGNQRVIPPPGAEPTIGVIDTLFSPNTYFSTWVSSMNMIDESIFPKETDFRHGTAVTSLVVDGPSLNPELDDGCGRFRVRHFAVANGGQFSSFYVLQSIRKIVRANPDIKVWNLSLGAELPINEHFISPEAAELDRIQFENDVIFVVAGTNDEKRKGKTFTLPAKPIGAPADSINSLVVNAVGKNEAPASYSRQGPVLAFFHKPDVSYFGGDTEKKMRVWTEKGEGFMQGTSLAAPWVARKLAYLIHIMGFTREVAKALLIDSAAAWNLSNEASRVTGFGVVPQRIENILQSPSDEIRFVIAGVSEKYDTYNYQLPIPIAKNAYPFVSKATLCYFPRCTRNQGVDYTNTELNLRFGRLKKSSGIQTINDDKQATHAIYEGVARKHDRKWDNAKHIVETLKERTRPKTILGKPEWGISILRKERLTVKEKPPLHFGLVITLKEINGLNRIDEFEKLCEGKQWIVHRVDMKSRLDIYAAAEETITFEE